MEQQNTPQQHRPGKDKLNNANVEVNVNINGQEVKVNQNGLNEEENNDVRTLRVGNNDIEVDVRVEVDVPEREGAVGGIPPEDPKVAHHSDFSGYDSGYFDYGKKLNEMFQNTIQEEESTEAVNNNDAELQKKTEIRRKRARKIKEKQQNTRRSSLAEVRGTPMVMAPQRRLSIDQRMDSSDEDVEEQQKALSGGLNTLIMLHKLQRFLHQHAPDEPNGANNATSPDKEETKTSGDQTIPSINIIDEHNDSVDVESAEAESIKPGILKPAFKMDLGDISDADDVFTADTVLPEKKSEKKLNTRTESIIIDDDSENKAGIIYDANDVSQITPEQLKEMGIELHEGEVLKFKEVLVLDDAEDKEGHHHHHIIPLSAQNDVTDTKIEEIAKQAEKAMEQEQKPRFRSRTIGSLRTRANSTDKPPARVPTLTRDTYMRFFDYTRGPLKGTELETKIEKEYGGVLEDLDRIQEQRRASGLDTSGLGGYHKPGRSKQTESFSDSEGMDAVFVYPQIPLSPEKPANEISFRKQQLAKNLEKDNEKREKPVQVRPLSVVSFSDVKKKYERTGRHRNDGRERTRSMLDTLHPTWSVQDKKGKFETAQENGNSSPTQRATSPTTRPRVFSEIPSTNNDCTTFYPDLEKTETYFETNLDEDLDIVELRRPTNRQSRSRIRSAPTQAMSSSRPETSNSVSPGRLDNVNSSSSGGVENVTYVSPRSVSSANSMPATRFDNLSSAESPYRAETTGTVSATPPSKEHSSFAADARAPPPNVQMEDGLAPPMDLSRKGSMGDDWFLSSFTSTKHLKLPKKKTSRDHSPFREDSNDWFYSFDRSDNSNNNNNNNNNNNGGMMRMVAKRKIQKQTAVDDRSVERQLVELCSGLDTFEPPPQRPGPSHRDDVRRFQGNDGYVSDSCGRSFRHSRMDSGYNSISSPRGSMTADVLKCMEDEGSDDEFLRQKCLDVFRTWHHQDAVRKEFKKLQKVHHKQGKSEFKVIPSDDNSTTSSTGTSSSTSSSHTHESVFH